MTRRKLIIDTDPGIDDAMAILLAACHPQLDLIGLTTVFGNVPIEKATRNALALTELLGHDIPVAEGVARPLERAPLPPPDFVHGTEGFGDVVLSPTTLQPDPRHAARFISETVAANPGEVTLCAVGPLTNLALAYRQSPEIADNVDEVIVMGGAVWTDGNVTPHAEANIWNDPHAALEVFAAPWSVTLVGLDVTEQVRCTPADFARIASMAPNLGGFLEQAAQFYFAFHRKSAGFNGCYMHDPTAVLKLTDSELFHCESHPVAVSLSGNETGRTSITTGQGPSTRICRDVDADGVRRRFIEVMTQGDACRGMLSR